MKTMKLNALESQSLSNKEMNNVRGGDIKVCGCSCCCAGTPGGSSTSANSDANVDEGLRSPDCPPTPECEPTITTPISA